MKNKIILLYQDFTPSVIQTLKKCNMRKIGLHFNPYEQSFAHYSRFILDHQEFIQNCHGLNIEYEFHALSILLPRNCYKKDKTLFRINQKGRRTNDFNLCPSSQKALQIVEQNAYLLASFLKQRSHRYHFWLDDNLGKPIMCHCKECIKFSLQQQSEKMYEAILKGIRRYDSKAKISYLLYGEENLTAPLNTDDYFIEYAPFYRNHLIPLQEFENEFYVNQLKNLLLDYKKQDIEVLEYFLSFDLKKFCMEEERVKKDIYFYHHVLSISSLSTFLVNNQKDHEENLICGIKKYCYLLEESYEK